MAVKILADLWLLIAILVHVATIAVAIASLAGPYWMDGPTVHFGLWNYCFKHITQTYSDKCYKVTDVEDDAITIDGYFRATQALMCLGCIATLPTFLLIFALIFMLVGPEKRKYALFITVVFTFVQGMMLFAGSCVFLSQKTTYGGDQMSTDWAHYLGWTGCCTSFLTACLLVVHYALNRDVYEEL
ncbi:uncharacterized protein LOC142339781 [Convolutriloba macropyga]|uniref:uncharacterized protein LOC142339781 n=1 Tax=Convolutriloba macropyga TaxID=536237 RepID=UPI003F528694